jgi:hypothetical protein
MDSGPTKQDSRTKTDNAAFTLIWDSSTMLIQAEHCQSQKPQTQKSRLCILSQYNDKNHPGNLGQKRLQ